MPKHFERHPPSGQALPELLRSLSAKLVQGASAISYGPALVTVRVPPMYSFPRRATHHSFKIKILEDDTYVGLTMLRRDINHLQSPLYRLPHELFPEVALHLDNGTDLVNFTHVSHRPRAALLSHSSLWSHLDFKHATRAFAFLERSKLTPLRVNLVGVTNAVFDPVELIRQHGSRILALNLHNCHVQLELLSQPMPYLRRLEIYDDCGCAFGAEIEWSLFDEILWPLSSLTSLILYRICLTPFRVPQLTRFKFQDMEPLTTIDQLLDFLDGCPLLEHIEISYEAQSASGRYQLVSLPNLRTYTQIMLDDTYSLEVLDMLSLPSPSSITLACRSGHTGAAKILPRFRDQEYLTGIKRVHLGSQSDRGREWVTGLLEFVNTEGTRVCLERFGFHRMENRLFSLETAVDKLELAQLKCLEDLDVRSAEVLSIGGYGLYGGLATSVETIKDALCCLGGVTTLILSCCDERTCLLALDPDGGRQLPPIHTLIIHSHDPLGANGRNTLQTLLTIAKKRKSAGFPFSSVSVFLRGVHDPTQARELEGAQLELKGCIEKFELVTGDDVLGWESDEYFFEGLEYLREHQDVRWDWDNMYAEHY